MISLLIFIIVFVTLYFIFSKMFQKPKTIRIRATDEDLAMINDCVKNGKNLIICYDKWSNTYLNFDSIGSAYKTLILDFDILPSVEQQIRSLEIKGYEIYTISDLRETNREDI